jgi:hypothetical protein
MSSCDRHVTAPDSTMTNNVARDQMTERVSDKGYSH